MDVLGIILVFIGTIVFIVSLIWLLISILNKKSKKTPLLIGLISIALLVIGSLIPSGIEQQQSELKEEQTQKSGDNKKGQYTIIKEEKLSDIKTMIDVRLTSEVDKEILTKIANEIRKDGRGNFDRIFINYYLPEMEMGMGAWAISHFNPDLEVQIMGLTQEEKTQLLEETDITLTLPFASSLVFAANMYSSTVQGTTFKKHHNIAQGILSEDDTLLAEIHFNPYSLPQLEIVTHKLEFLKHVIRQQDLDEADCRDPAGRSWLSPLPPAGATFP